VKAVTRSRRNTVEPPLSDNRPNIVMLFGVEKLESFGYSMVKHF